MSCQNEQDKVTVEMEPVIAENGCDERPENASGTGCCEEQAVQHTHHESNDGHGNHGHHGPGDGHGHHGHHGPGDGHGHHGHHGPGEDHEHHGHHSHHTHDIPQDGNPDRSLILLRYMYDHNMHHAEELVELAASLRSEGREEAAGLLDEALNAYRQGNELLGRALGACGKPDTVPET